MSKQLYIAKHPILEPSQDYVSLRKEGIAYIEKLAHKLWTDYNVHDPGITFLELACYAITDLGYRTAYPIEDLLTREEDGTAISLGDFHTARNVLSCNPVNFYDLAKLLVDIPGVRNAWIEINREYQLCLDRQEQALVYCSENSSEPQTLNGLYDVYIEYEEERIRDQLAPHHAGLGKKLAREGGYIAANRAGIVFDAEAPFTLESVSVYAEAAGTVTIRLLNRRGKVVQTVDRDINIADKKVRLDLGFKVTPGKGYRLEAQGSIKLYRNKVIPGVVEFPMGLDRLITLRGGFKEAKKINDIYYFFYDWIISFLPESQGDGVQPQDVQLLRRQVERQIRDRLHAYRNLCEEPVRLCKLIPEEVGVCADLELAPGADAEQVLTEIFVRLRQHVSPPVRFYSLQEMVDKGCSSEEIFSGPPLDHGFIDDHEFKKRRQRCEIRASDVINIIMSVEGVLAVHKLSLLAFQEGTKQPHAQAEWLLPLKGDKSYAPSFKWQRSKIIFYQKKLPRYPDRKRVETLLRERHEGDVRRRMRSEEEPHDLPVPTGADRDLADFYPAQNELPMTYRVGQHRVSEYAPPLRHAQAKQLKAYLMFFEQFLANYLSQLQQMYKLFSWQEVDNRTYFTQLVDGVSDRDQLYLQTLADEGDLLNKLRAIIEDESTAATRRNQFLDHLLGRFCESLTDYSLIVYERYGKDFASQQRMIETKRAFLQNYPAASAARGKAHDYRDATLPGMLSGFQYRLYHLLGFGALQRRNLAGHEIEIEKDELQPDQPWRFVLKLKAEGANSKKVVFVSGGCEDRDSIVVLLDIALQLAGDEANYRKVGSRYELVVRCEDREPQVIGTTTPQGRLEQIVAYFDALSKAKGFHLIENILLRPRGDDDPLMPVQLLGEAVGECHCVEVTDPYSFRMSIILPSWPADFQESRFRDYVEETLRRESPSHIFPRICWVSHGQMLEFEQVYRAWERSLALLMAEQPTCEAPEVEASLQAEYRERLGDLIRVMHQLDNVHPLARLYDCDSTEGEIPRVFLDHSNLGTF